MKNLCTLAITLAIACGLSAQSSVLLPAGGGNIKNGVSQRIGTTDVSIHWDAPGVKGREGKIWGTTVAHYGFQNLGFGTAKESPWRAGANESTSIAFSTEVMIEGKLLPAGKYGFFIALYPDSCTLIFSKNSTGWGSYFYNPTDDALQVTVRQKKDQPSSREWLNYEFSDQTDHSASISLVWERWRIPFTVSVDLKKVVVENLRRELETDKGFVFENWVAAAQFCHDQDTNLEEALTWADNGVNSFFGVKTFGSYSLKAKIQEKLGKKTEAAETMKLALNYAAVFELHGYGRQLIGEKKPKEALEVFLLNQKKNGDAWPVHVGLMRGYSATGDLKKALEHGKVALGQAPDDLNKKSLEASIKALTEGKAIAQ